MQGAIWDHLFDNGYMPHGYCLLWDPLLFWAHAGSDALIAASYFSIPAVLMVFALRRREFQFRWVLFLFGAFIVCCGLTHLLGIWTLWVGSYGIEAVVKVVTALVSVATAVALWPLIPRVLALPSTGDLERRNQALAEEVTRRERTQAELALLNRELEDRVAARTADLAAKNDQLVAAMRRAEEANEAKGRFLSMMSHEIRTPLNAVINMADLMIEAERGGSDRGYLGAIATSSKALLGIVEDILDLSRIEAGRIRIQPVPASVEDIVEEVVQSVAPLAHRKGLDIASTIGPGVPAQARIDPARVRQILLNLIGNAVRYTEAGWVHVDVDLVAGDGGRELVFDVVDTGVGIDPADHGRIFERFTQVGADQGEAGGTGLGLTISRQLAERMGGRITLRSRAGEGSAFRLALPATEAGSPPVLECDTEMTLLGPPSRTRQALAATLVHAGAELRLIDDPDVSDAAGPDAARADPAHAAGAAARRVALVVLPLGGDSRAAAQDWCRRAQAIAGRVVLLVPLGGGFADYDRLAGPGVQVETYPVGRRRLLECLQGDRPPDGDGPAADPARALDGVRVLVVDDNQENRLVAARALERPGAEVRTVTGGEAALSAIAAAAFDVVLLDLRMPGMDGFATAERIRALPGPAARLPLVAVSASITPETIAALDRAGFDGHLAKPFRPRDLRQAVARHTLRLSGAEGGHQPVPRRAAAAELPVFDAGILGAAVDQTDRGTVQRIIDGFLGRVDGQLAAIDGAAPGEPLADALHSLAGSAGAVGLIELARQCSDAEQRLRGGEGGVDRATIRHAAARAIDALRDWHRGTPG
ncbi:ATP-binding protein [Marinibaculum pumilum]|uniref:histidine kinase n=1 Tax=Marinibaculum pumilum TaxID=1766165 RepID=A0ABV7L1F0_9PROT